MIDRYYPDISDWLAQLDPLVVEKGSDFLMTYPAIGAIILVVWLNHRANERRDARDRESTLLREKVWVDVAKQGARLATEGQRLQEKTLDCIKEASASLTKVTDRAEFERHTK